MPTKVVVWPKIGEPYPDAAGVTITAAGAIVWESKYIEDAIRDGFLLTYDPLGVNLPADHTDVSPPAPRNASYVLATSAPAVLEDARVLAAGAGIAIADAGAGGTLTISATGGGGGAPVDAQYLVSAAHGTLSAERVLTAGAGITLTPGAGTLTVASTVTGGAPTTAQYLTLASDSNLANERVLTAGTGITLTDGGAGGPLTISSSVAGGAPTDAEYLVATTHAGLSAERVLTAGAGISITPSAGVLTVATLDAVQGPASSIDNRITRWDGTTGKLVQSSSATLDDAGLLSTASLSISGNVAVAGTVDGVDVGNLGAVPFVTIGASATVANERALTAGAGISITDGGAGGPVTVASTVAAGAPTDAQYLVTATHAGLSAERVLTAGAGITLTPAAGTLTIASTVDISTKADKLIPLVTLAGSSLTLALVHSACMILCTYDDYVTITIPRDSTLNLPLGFTVTVMMTTVSEGLLRIVSEVASGSYGIPARMSRRYTNPSATPKTIEAFPFVPITLIKYAADTWLCDWNNAS